MCACVCQHVNICVQSFEVGSTCSCLVVYSGHCSFSQSLLISSCGRQLQLCTAPVSIHYTVQHTQLTMRFTPQWQCVAVHHMYRCNVVLVYNGQRASFFSAGRSSKTQKAIASHTTISSISDPVCHMFINIWQCCHCYMLMNMCSMQSPIEWMHTLDDCS